MKSFWRNDMKKLLALLLAAALLVCLCAGCKDEADSAETTAPTETTAETAASTEAQTEAPAADYHGWRVALLTEETAMAELSRSRTVFDAGKAWCEARGIPFSSYAPTESAKGALVELIEQAIANGNTALLLPGWTILDAIKDTAPQYPNVSFILPDVAAESFGKNYELPSNVCTLVFPEQVLGFMAGYAAVKLGYRHLCYMGTAKSNAVNRYGFGFVQGADAAAAELDTVREIAVEFVYANSQTDDPAVTAYLDELFQNRGIELCFVCSGVARSVCEAAQKVAGAKVICADIDFSPLTDAENEENVLASCAIKDYTAAVQNVLSDLIENGKWRNYAGRSVSLGLASGEDPEANFIELAQTTQFDDGRFSKEDYAALVAALYAGDYEISDDAKNTPKTAIAVNYRGNIK